MKLLQIIIIFTWFYGTLNGQYNEVFPKQVIIENDCNLEVINGVLKLWGPPDKPMKIFNLRSDLCEIEFFSDGNKIEIQDTLKTSTEEELEIKFRFTNYDSEIKEVYFSTLHTNENAIQINLGGFYISHEDVKSGKTKSINIKNNCSDSIQVFFPAGGTVTGVTVHNNAEEMAFIKSVGFGMGDEVNYIKFAKTETGRYYIRYAACHWGENFWLEINK
jgi:hypothetical protein